MFCDAALEPDSLDPTLTGVSGDESLKSYQSCTLVGLNEDTCFPPITACPDLLSVPQTAHCACSSQQLLSPHLPKVGSLPGDPTNRKFRV